MESSEYCIKFIAQLSFWMRARSLDLLWSQNTNETKSIHIRLDLIAACVHLSFSGAPSQWRKTKLQPDMNKQMQTNMTNQKGSRWHNKTRRLTVRPEIISLLKRNNSVSNKFLRTVNKSWFCSYSFKWITSTWAETRDIANY